MCNAIWKSILLGCKRLERKETGTRISTSTFVSVSDASKIPSPSLSFGATSCLAVCTIPNIGSSIDYSNKTEYPKTSHIATSRTKCVYSYPKFLIFARPYN